VKTIISVKTNNEKANAGQSINLIRCIIQKTHLTKQERMVKMKIKLIFSTKTKNFEQWTNAPFIPRLCEKINLLDILKPEEVQKIKDSAPCWSGVKGTIHSVEYRHDDSDFYVEIYVWCED